MNNAKLALILGAIAFALLVVASIIRVSRGQGVDIFHVIFGVSLLVFVYVMWRQDSGTR